MAHFTLALFMTGEVCAKIKYNRRGGMYIIAACCIQHIKTNNYSDLFQAESEGTFTLSGSPKCDFCG